MRSSVGNLGGKSTDEAVDREARMGKVCSLGFNGAILRMRSYWIQECSVGESLLPVEVLYENMTWSLIYLYGLSKSFYCISNLRIITSLSRTETKTTEQVSFHI